MKLKCDAVTTKASVESMGRSGAGVALLRCLELRQEAEGISWGWGEATLWASGEWSPPFWSGIWAEHHTVHYSPCTAQLHISPSSTLLRAPSDQLLCKSSHLPALASQFLLGWSRLPHPWELRAPGHHTLLNFWLLCLAGYFLFKGSPRDTPGYHMNTRCVLPCSHCVIASLPPLELGQLLLIWWYPLCPPVS